jgi:nucleoside-diphosphate-sugar epimerase
MKVLFIGGTGNISTAVSKLAVAKGIDLYHLNRGKANQQGIPGVKNLLADINEVDTVKKVLQNHSWDVVVNWIAFVPEHIQRDYEIFQGRTRQYIFISSASAYQKPLLNAKVTESTPLKNPYWQYSRNKIACEDLLLKLYRENDFPITIVRPSHTYSNFIPSCFGFDHHYTLVNRIVNDKPILVPGTGLSRWTLTHAEDFAKAFVGLLGHQDAIGHPFHITSDEKLTWNQIYMEIGAALEKKPKLVHVPLDALYKFTIEHSGNQTDVEELRGGMEGDKLTNVDFDNSKIKAFVPEFKATIPFREGIRKVLAWFDEEPTRKIVDAKSDAYMDWLLERWQHLMD